MAESTLHFMTSFGGNATSHNPCRPYMAAMPVKVAVAAVLHLPFQGCNKKTEGRGVLDNSQMSYCAIEIHYRCEGM